MNIERNGMTGLRPREVKRRRDLAMQVSETWHLAFTAEDARNVLRRMEGTSKDAAADAIRRQWNLPAGSLRGDPGQARRQLAAAIAAAGGKPDRGCATVRLRDGRFAINIRLRPGVATAVRGGEGDTQAVSDWYRTVFAEISHKRDMMLEALRRGHDDAADGAEGGGEVQIEWPMSTNAKSMEAAGRSLATETIRKNALDRRLSTIGFHDLRSLHRGTPLAPRRIVALLGPTNSGKTHEGLGMLAEASRGAYLAPLRLLAMENHETLNGRGVLCDLVTGEEEIRVEGATHVSSTIEMLDLGSRYDVVLIDEIQMLGDQDRGWAWTRALLSADAATVVVAGSEDALPLIERIAAITGDTLDVRRFERRNPLETMPGVVAVRDLEPGDALIAFSRKDVLGWKEVLDAAGKSSAVIYGSLGPEVRRAEAARFRSGHADVLIATDAIGMGLNLPIRRVLFTASAKFDGHEERALRPAEVRQIGGRAGRYADDGPGLVGRVPTCGGREGWIEKALSRSTSLPDVIHVAPTWDGVRRIMEENKVRTVRKALDLAADALKPDPTLHYELGSDDKLLLSMVAESGLGHAEQFRYLGMPLNVGQLEHSKIVASWLQAISHRRKPPLPTLAGLSPDDANDLRRYEMVAAQAGAYMWLARRFPDHYQDGPRAVEIRDAATRTIAAMLAKGGMRRTCRDCGTKLPPRWPHASCQGCHEDRSFNHHDRW